MPVDAREETGDLVHLMVRDRMTTADQAALVYFITKAVQRHRRIRLLVTLESFAGWEADEGWDDASLRIDDDSAIVKAAFVGDAKWQDDILAFVGKPFRTTPTEYFTTEPPARAWLSA